MFVEVSNVVTEKIERINVPSAAKKKSEGLSLKKPRASDFRQNAC